MFFDSGLELQENRIIEKISIKYLRIFVLIVYNSFICVTNNNHAFLSLNIRLS